MQAHIITIGDELLIGQVVDTNSAWMAEQLNEIGVSVYQITSVHDDANHIRQALTLAMQQTDIVLLTGGLGPTKDDITKHVLCEFFHTTLVEDAQVKKHVEELYRDRPQVMNRLTATQWLVPRSATILPNRVGSAPIMLWNDGNRVVVSMPGVPREMEIAMEEQVLPYLQQWMHSLHINTHIYHRTLTVQGIPESALAIEIEDWENHLPKGLHLAYLPKDGKIRLRLSSYGECTAQTVESEFTRLAQLVQPYLLSRS